MKHPTNHVFGEVCPWYNERMRIFVTAGNTQTPIDRVRCITNIFTGRTGASIALEAYRRGHEVTLATSHPEVIDAADPDPKRWHCLPYRTFEDLERLMREQIAEAPPNVVVHCAAVGDFHAAGVFAPAPGTRFEAEKSSWIGGEPRMVNRAAGKVKSDEPELWLRLVRAPKLVDKIRDEWGYRGVLVKFKLEVSVSESELLEVAEKSRQQSQADWMVANTLEGAADWALVGSALGYEKVQRAKLAVTLLDVIEQEGHRG